MAPAPRIDGSGRNIFYFWDRPETFPKAFADNLARTRKAAPGWTVHLADDASLRDELGDDPDLRALYDDIRVPACRSDIARLLLLRRHGGWYLDADIRVLGGLDRFGQDGLVLFRRDDPFAQKHGITGRITNMAFYAPPGDRFVTTALEAIRDHAARGRFLYSVRDFSGPVLFSRLAKAADLPEGTQHGFDAAFNGPGASFSTSMSGSSASWKLQQHFGLRKGLAPKVDRFPEQITDRKAKILIAFARRQQLQEAFLAVIEARPAYLENALCRQAAEEFRAAGASPLPRPAPKPTRTPPARTPPAKAPGKAPGKAPRQTPGKAPAKAQPKRGAQKRAKPAGPKIFCIQGLFRSGTNFARALFEMNYDCLAEYDSYGWKHGPYPARTPASRIKLPDLPTLFVTKNPVHSLSSLYTYAAGGVPPVRSAADRGAAAFLRAPIVIHVGADPQSPEFYYENPIAFWNSANWNYLSTVGKKPQSMHVRYEDMVADPERAIAGLAASMGLRRKSDRFEVPSKRLRNLRTGMHDPSAFESAKAFDTGALDFDSYAKVFSDEDLALIVNGVNPELAARAGYAPFLEEVAARL